MTSVSWSHPALQDDPSSMDDPILQDSTSANCLSSDFTEQSIVAIAVLNIIQTIIHIAELHCAEPLKREDQSFGLIMEKISFGKDALPGYICGEKKAPGILVIQGMWISDEIYKMDVNFALYRGFSIAVTLTGCTIPNVTFVSEWWGVTDIIKGHAERLSKKGYRCLVPDIYHGKIGIDKEEAHHLFSNLDWPRAVEELGQAVQFLKDEGSEKVGAIGFCMGGALAVAACQHCGIDCAAPFYGTPQKQLSQPENVKVPVEFHTGELDASKGFSDPETVRTWADEINQAGGNAVVYVYEKCGHAFINAGQRAVELREMMSFPEPPQSEQELAWSRVDGFFEKHLKS